MAPTPAPLNSPGSAPPRRAPSHAGAYTAVATFPGSTDYATATKLANFTIAKATPQLAWAAPAAITYGTPLSLGAQLDASAGGLRGSFSYTPGPGAILDAGAGQKLSVTFTPTDTADYNTATKSTTITVDPARPMLTVSAPGGSFDGSPIGATVTIAVVGAGTDNTPSASLEDIKPTLTYYAGSGTSGTNLGTTPPSAPGTYTVVGSFVGSTDYEAVQSAPVTFAIGKGAATVALASSGGSAVYGQSITFVATVNAAGAKPDGRVTFSDGGTAIGSAPVDGSGRATLTVASLALGSHSITANYDGGNGLVAATSGPVAESVTTDATRVVLVPHGVFKKRKLVSIELTATIDPAVPGGGTPTGEVTFKVRKKMFGTASLVGSAATLRVKAARVLKKPVTVIYGGTEDFASSEVTLPVVSAKRG